jgi:RimJ/RimL family protein N-acetyltransferase
LRQQLTTSRLDCEPLVAGHAQLLFPELSNAALYAFIPQDPPVNINALAVRFVRLEHEPHSPDGSELWLNWAMRERATGTYVGTLEASVVPGRSAEIAYFVFTPHQRRGYAKEGVGALIEHLFESHQVGVVIAEIDTRNRPSIALVESLGFERVAHTANADFFKGAASDEYRFELHRQS